MTDLDPDAVAYASAGVTDVQAAKAAGLKRDLDNADDPDAKAAIKKQLDALLGVSKETATTSPPETAEAAGE